VGFGWPAPPAGDGWRITVANVEARCSVYACGVIRLFNGRYLSLHVVDPDGMRLEVGCLRTGSDFDDAELEIAG
jgi:hypothetical protein